MKTCRHCREQKEFTDFYKAKQNLDGIENLCKDCKNYIQKLRRIKNPEKYRIKDRKRRPQGSRWWAKYAEKWNQISAEHKKRNPEKHRAVILLNRALNKGDITKPDRCTKCNKMRKLQGHHDDYSQPLSVRWLCQSCHQIHHGRERYIKQGLIETDMKIKEVTNGES